MILIQGNLYIYENSGINDFFCYLGDTSNKKKIYGAEVGYKDFNRSFIEIKEGIDKVIFTDKLLEIDIIKIKKPWFLSGKVVNLSSNIYIEIVSKILLTINGEIYSDYNRIIYNNYSYDTNSLLNQFLPEMLLNHVEWIRHKNNLKFSNTIKVPSVMKYHIYFANLGQNIGSEFNKTRPVLIWKQHINNASLDESSYYVFPISTSSKLKKFYYNVEIILNNKKSYICLNDGRRISAKRIVSPFLLDDSNVANISVDIKNQINKTLLKYFAI